MKSIHIALLFAATVLVAGARADDFGTGTNQFSLTFSEVGYAGNAADGTGYGAVGYSYRMGLREVTVDQFAKALAADNRIGNGNEGYWNDGIRTVGTNAPVAYANWYEAAKFANWLTTGDAYTGAYPFDTNGTLVAVDRSAAQAAYGTIYVLPTEDEWYKAAYYKPVNDGSYSDFSSGNSPPIRGTTNGWNYAEWIWNVASNRWDKFLVNSAPNYMWEPGFGGEEQNGTYDMNGNAWEWCETAHDDLNGRVIRGGGYEDNEAPMSSGFRHEGFNPTNEHELVGFRIAAIPASQYWLALAVNGSGTVNVVEGWQPAGTNLSLVATPATNWLFMGWSGDLSGDHTTGSTNLVMDADKLITATFSDDADGDGLSNSTEVALGLNPLISNVGLDSDADGLGDLYEVNVLGTNPLVVDSDGDGLSDYEEIHNVVAWGDNYYKQTVVPSNMLNAVSIVAGGAYGLALLSDDSIVAWGDNYYQQCDVPAAVSNVLSIAAGDAHSLAVLSNGNVVAWGDDFYQQSDVPLSATNIVAAAGGIEHSAALRDNGNVMAWGSNNDGQLNIPPSVTNAIALAAGDYHNLALLTGGQVVAWGDNTHGACNVPAAATNAVAIAAGGGHSLALLNDGRVVAWGLDDFGQSTVPASVTNAISIAAGGYHSLAVLADGSTIVWGNPFYGIKTVPARVKYPASIDAGRLFSLALLDPTDPLDSDSDADGLTDGDEVNTAGTNPLVADSDGDGLSDGAEVNTHGTDPLDPDSDADAMPDGWEVANGLDPLINDAALDNDSDGLTNLEEYGLGADPQNPDSDADGLRDGAEVNTYGTNPLNVDSDADGMSDALEVTNGLDPLVDDAALDSDVDGLINLAELGLGTDPLNSDSDADGLLDGAEVNTFGTNPLDSDSDHDAMPDGWEVGFALNPLTTNALADADSDGRTDLYEFAMGGNPTNGLDIGIVPFYVVVQVGGTNGLDYIHVQWTNAVALGLAYGLELTDDPIIGTWTNAGYSITGQSSLSNGFESVTNRMDAWASTNLYIRLAVATSNDVVYSVATEITPLDFWAGGFGLYGTNAAPSADPDADGLDNTAEFNAGTDPLIADSDADGLSDGAEVNTYSTNPLIADSDADGLSDGAEVNTYSTNPLVADSDGDGLLDGAEVNTHATNPLNADTDGDSFGDGQEVANGGSPLVSDLWRVDYIRNNGSAYDLYSSNAVLDISIGQAGFEVTNGTAWLSLQLEESKDLITWTNAGDEVIWSIPVDLSNAFYRVRSGR